LNKKLNKKRVKIYKNNNPKIKPTQKAIPKKAK